MKICSVIIVNYNTGQLLKQAVDAVLCNDIVNEVIVVDNRSHDGSMELLDTTTSIRLKKFYRKENHGFASSCNYAAKIAQSNTLLFLNPDCIVTSNTIAELLEDLDNKTSSSAAIIGCWVQNPDGSEQRACRRRLPTLLRAIKTFSGIEKLAKFCDCFAGVNLNHKSIPNKVHQVEAISGAFIMMKAKVFKQLKGFDEKYPMHFEDLDLFKRTQQAGFHIFLNPNVKVIHYQGTSSKTNPKVVLFKELGRQRYFKEHLSYLSYLIVKLLK